VIELCRRQLDFGDGLIAEEVGDLWEDWMRHVDTVLEDPVLLDLAYEALACRWRNSRTRGRKGTPVDVVVRLLVLKHMRNWSYAVLEREVRANLVYRQFTRIGAAKVPDAKTLGKLGLALGPAVIEQIHVSLRRRRAAGSRPQYMPLSRANWSCLAQPQRAGQAAHVAVLPSTDGHRGARRWSSQALRARGLSRHQARHTPT
jgi:hypothetical protein